MTDFERELVRSFNDFFGKKENPDGIAHRKKQHRFSSQLCDVLVDSPDDEYYLAIENKSIKTESNNKLYFSRHFSEADGKHQVERINDFVDRSGRTGYLAVEFKRGRGKKRRAFVVPWSDVRKKYENGVGIPLEEVKDYKELKREGSRYRIEGVWSRG